MKSITKDTFESEVLNSDAPVLLEFYSDSCVPCKRMSPILAMLEEEQPGWKLVKINITFGAELARSYKVMSSPTFLFFKGGKECGRIGGVVKKEELESMLAEVVK